MTRHGDGPAVLPWLLLPARLVLFAVAQAAIAGIAWIMGGDGWAEGLRWWPFGIVLVNALTLAVLWRLAARDGGYRALLSFDPQTLRASLPSLALIGVVLVVLAVVPNIGLSVLILGGPDAGAELLAQPLPVWASFLLLLAFPLSIALVEIPLYFGWIMPRLVASGLTPWLAISVSAAFAAAQHITMPLIPNAGFLLWRLTMFLPFALALGIVLYRRRGVMVPLMVLHGLLDISVVALTF